MEFFIQLMLIALLVLVTYQDYKFRAVSWILFPLLLCGFFFFNSLSNPLSEIVTNTIANLCFIVFLFTVITVYFSIKHRRLVNLSNGFIGWGDILFILCLGFLFSPLNFMLFYLFSLILIISGVLISGWILKKRSEQIPLAGLQALLLTILVLVNLLFPFFKFSTDEWLVNVLLL